MHSFDSSFFDKMTNSKQDLKIVHRKLKLEEYVQEKLDRLDRPLKSYSHFMLDSQPNYCYPLRPSAPLPAHGLSTMFVCKILIKFGLRRILSPPRPPELRTHESQ